MYEFFIGMFMYNIPGRKCKKRDGDKIIAELTVSLKKDEAPKETDGLESVINDMFDDCTELENTRLEIHDDYTGIPDAPVDEAEGTNPNSTHNNNCTVPKISLANVFEQGREEMLKANMAEVRVRKKNRIERSRQFMLDINTSVTEMKLFWNMN